MATTTKYPDKRLRIRLAFDPDSREYAALIGLTSRQRQKAILAAFAAVCYNIIPQETVFNAAVLNPPKPTRASKPRQRPSADEPVQRKPSLLDSIPLDTAQILSDFQGAKFSFASKSS